MHRFVDIEVWPLNKGQDKIIISYSNSLKVIKHDEKVKKESYWKKIWGKFCLCSCERENVKIVCSSDF